jgi:hypothetical protein
VFSVEQRERLRSDLLRDAANDPRITSAAVTGSAAGGREDRWSDIDLAFGVVSTSELGHVLSDWTTHMYDRCSAVHHVDVVAGAWTYRVFLLPGTLQVDLAFVPQTDFRALAPTFSLVFGNAREPQHSSPPSPEEIVGLAWLYAIHARTCIARRKLWQAEYMISGMRDQALALACLRHDLPTAHGRGMDQLPVEVATQFEDGIVRHLEAAELSRAFRVVIYGLLSEIRVVDGELAERLRRSLVSLTEASAGI